MLAYEQAAFAVSVIFAATVIGLLESCYHWFVLKRPLPLWAFIALFGLLACSGGIVGRILVWYVRNFLEGKG